MYQKKIERTLDCGAVLTMEVLHGKWKTTLLHFIARSVQRPSDLQRAIPSATRRVLNLQLNELEQHGLIAPQSRVLPHALGRVAAVGDCHHGAMGQPPPGLAGNAAFGNACRLDRSSRIARQTCQ
jgi:hypothetical protein